MRVAWCALFAMLLASVAHASNYVVDGAGGGNFTLIQSAVYAQAVSPRDTVFVRSGSYPEVVTFTNDVPMMWLVGVAGASATTLLSITVSSDVFDRRWYFDGLKFDGAMDLGRKGYVAEFKRCVFAQGLSEELDCWPGNLTDCAFHGRTFVTGGASGGIGPEFTRLHFIGAPLHIESSGCGDLTYADCTFEGPADTLVIGKAGRADNAIRIVRSNFANADFGLVFPEQGYFDQDDVVDSCSFSDLAIAGVWHDEPPNTTSSGGRSTRVMTCAVKHSRFDRCGTAVHWLTGFAGAQTMLADTIRDCTGDGVVATLGTMTDVIISRSGGHGLVLKRRGIRPSQEMNILCG